MTTFAVEMLKTFQSLRNAAVEIHSSPKAYLAMKVRMCELKTLNIT